MTVKETKRELETSGVVDAKGDKQADRAWERPRILWEEDIQTLGYKCDPYNGSIPTSNAGCPP